ncbi:hypothetical protein OU994_24695 [Pseudoduganella sp. SL102]|uniref:Uncharacterized protein n=1 Tax=Pseudoduganella albidiflava TaxID=321983 RepID=A0ABX5S4I7_9BURK|nr:MULTISPECIES: hypothetical protein [Pseudoduganella]QBI04864.1 hypothetical protein EYF70_06210 [Pseudoduganella albidiflava]WBS05843.1 hypothetical protein OU994_24695 [Pseudoduganella sp. SL102]
MIAGLLVAGAAFVSYQALVEAYGPGPPYYSRTTNMDKWSDPLPEIVIADVIALAIAAALVRTGVRRLGKTD